MHSDNKAEDSGCRLNSYFPYHQLKGINIQSQKDGKNQINEGRNLQGALL